VTQLSERVEVEWGTHNIIQWPSPSGRIAGARGGGHQVRKGGATTAGEAIPCYKLIIGKLLFILGKKCRHFVEGGADGCVVGQHALGYTACLTSFKFSDST